MPFHVALDKEPLRALNELAEQEKKRERDWVAAQRRELLDGLSRRQATLVRREIRVDLAARRKRGEFTGTRDDLVAQALRAELRARGLDKEWPAPPDGEVDAPGRRWGTPPSRQMGEGGYDARLSLKLPHDLAETLRRAAYWTSQAAVEALQEWDERWGKGPEITLQEAERDGVPGQLALLAAAGRPSAPQAALNARDELRARILTTGDLIRAAVNRAVGSGQAELPEAP